jgi:hypothetical protein
MLDVEKLIDGIHEYIERALKPLAERVKAVEARPEPKDGTSVTLDDVRPVIEEAVKAIPIPKDGKDGVSVTIEDVMPALSEVAAEAA